MYISNFVFLVFAFFTRQILCGCRHSYLTFCDDLADLKKYNVENWTELVLGKEDGERSQLHSVNYDKLALNKFESLTTMIIVQQLKDIKTKTFVGKPEETKLENLLLYGNEIKRIRSTTFGSLTLRKLSLVNNSIEYIHKGAFHNCDIRVIDFSRNKLDAIERDIFTDEFLKNTKELILKNNKIETIQPSPFPTSLEILNLDYNNLNYLGYKLFDDLVNLQTLTLSHNRITSLPGLSKLKNVRVIDASYNRILLLNVTDFNNLAQLEVLDLSHNSLSYPLTFNRFNFPERQPSLQISLAFNKLTHLILEDDSFRHHIMFLYGNPWDCKCWAMLEKFMLDNAVKRNPCDLKYFGTGHVPYCIGYDSIDCTKAVVQKPDFTSSDIEKFLELISQTESQVGCNLSPKKL